MATVPTDEPDQQTPTQEQPNDNQPAEKQKAGQKGGKKEEDTKQVPK